MDSFWKSIQNNPVTLTEAIRQTILMLIVFGVLKWTEQQIAVTLMAISAILSLFVRSNTLSITRIEQRVEEKVAHREMAGTTGTGEGLKPSDTPGPATKGM